MSNIIDCVNTETNTCIFGYGGIDVGVINQTIIFKGIKPPQGAGTKIWNDGCTEKIGDWGYTGSKLSITFKSMDDVELISKWLNDIELALCGTTYFNGITLDFTKYEQASMNVVKSAMKYVRLNMLQLIAC